MPNAGPVRPVGPGGLRRPGGPGTRTGATYGEPPTPAPVAIAIGVTSVTPTSATLVGSVDTQGITGTWWFVWGLDTTLSGGATAVGTARPLETPQVVQSGLTGLTTGLTYWFAVVIETAGGTVVSVPKSFVPQAAKPSVSQINPSQTVLDVTVPHFSWPFTVTDTGVSVAQQDSDQEIDSCVIAVFECTIGEWPENPNFGVPDETFQTAPLNTEGVVATVLQWEPRASISGISAMVQDGTEGTWINTYTTEA